ncbi:hypothetical protein PFISCL1PPCAC_18989, partial [Pristionchus fissidentatus]
VFQLRQKDVEKGYIALACEIIFVFENDDWIEFTRKLIHLKHQDLFNRAICIENNDASFAIWSGCASCDFKHEDLVSMCKDEKAIKDTLPSSFTPARVEKYNDSFEEFLWHSGFYLVP